MIMGNGRLQIIHERGMRLLERFRLEIQKHWVAGFFSVPLCLWWLHFRHIQDSSTERWHCRGTVGPGPCSSTAVGLSDNK